MSRSMLKLQGAEPHRSQPQFCSIIIQTREGEVGDSHNHDRAEEANILWKVTRLEKAGTSTLQD